MCLIKSSTSFNTVQGIGIDDETTPSPCSCSLQLSLCDEIFMSEIILDMIFHDGLLLPSDINSITKSRIEKLYISLIIEMITQTVYILICIGVNAKQQTTKNNNLSHVQLQD